MIDGHGSLVGAFDALEYADTQLQLASGDTLLLYTDGVTEAGADTGLYGQARLLARLAAARGLPPEAVADAIVAEVLAWCDQAPQDDVTLLAMQRGAPD